MLQVCFEVAVVTEPGGGGGGGGALRRPVSVCSEAAATGTATAADVGGHGAAVAASRAVESVIAVSRSHRLRVELVNRHMLHTIGAFLIHFKGQRHIVIIFIFIVVV